MSLFTQWIMLRSAKRTSQMVLCVSGVHVLQFLSTTFLSFTFSSNAVCRITTSCRWIHAHVCGCTAGENTCSRLAQSEEMDNMLGRFATHIYAEDVLHKSTWATLVPLVVIFSRCSREKNCHRRCISCKGITCYHDEAKYRHLSSFASKRTSSISVRICRKIGAL